MTGVLLFRVSANTLEGWAERLVIFVPPMWSFFDKDCHI